MRPTPPPSGDEPTTPDDGSDADGPAVAGGAALGPVEGVVDGAAPAELHAARSAGTTIARDQPAGSASVCHVRQTGDASPWFHAGRSRRETAQAAPAVESIRGGCVASQAAISGSFESR